ncbi:hypothetical protein ACFOW1_06735 [Parasediminibacterium paludis]|uniref:Lipoprotein n=1 Tax=Parasediminibacterium paludis TaxID=908966 RepID=A0ABV8PXA2_9BACT
MRPTLLIFTTIILTLTSCEGFIHMQGRVIDNSTKQAIENVKVLLILRGKDTLANNKLHHDTVEYNDRLAIRKKGIKDDYKMYDTKGFSKLGPSITDTTGYFSIGNILVGCVPKCPTCQLLFIKDGYESLSVKLNSIVHDSMTVSLKKVSDKSFNSTSH